MTRWILLLFSLVSLALMFFGRSMGWVLFGVAGFLFGSIATALAFAQSRIASSARAEDLQMYQPPSGKGATGARAQAGESPD